VEIAGHNGQGADNVIFSGQSTHICALKGKVKVEAL
jgi:hypothetical protein